MNLAAHESTAPPARVPSHASRAFVVLLFLLAAYWGAHPYVAWLASRDIAADSRRFLAIDQDQSTHLINLAACRTFLSTFKYWTHDWSGGFPYWRPLTCQLFWIELRLFGPDRFDLWSAVSVVSQLAAEGLLAWLVRLLTGRWSIGAVAAVAFAGIGVRLALFGSQIIVWPVSMDSSQVLGGNWKNQPDIWMTGCVLGSVATALCGRWTIATALALAAPCFKENGWMAYPLILLFLALKGKMRTVPGRVAVVNVLFIVLWIVLRSFAHLKIHDIDTVGHNYSGLARYFDILAGPFFVLLQRTHLAQAVIAAGIAATIVAPRVNYRMRAALFAATLAAGAVVATADVGDGLVVGLMVALDPDGGLQETINGAIWLTGVLILLMDPDLRVTGAAMIVIRLISAATVTIALAVGPHTVYMSNAFYCAAWAMAAYAVWKRIRKACAPILAQSRRLASVAP